MATMPRIRRNEKRFIAKSFCVNDEKKVVFV
jgi:hypothetical protein